MRIGWLDTAKGFAIVGIVLIHVAAWAPADSEIARWVLDHLVMPLPVFFIVSGILAGPALTAHDTPARHLVTRITPLLYLYVLWQPGVFVYRLVGHSSAGEDLDLIGETARVIAAFVRPNGEIWYLWALALHFVLVWLTRRLPAVVVLSALTVVGAWVIGWGRSVVGDDLWHVAGPGLQGLPQFAFLTAIGAHLGPRLIANADRFGSPPVAVVAVCVWVAVGEAHARSTGIMEHALAVLHVVIGTASALVIARVLDDLRVTNPIRALGRWSIVPYLTHTAVIVGLLASAELLGATPFLVAHPTGTIAALTVVATLAGLVGYWPVRGTRADHLFRPPPAVHRWSDRPPRDRSSADILGGHRAPPRDESTVP
ncbi:acyltransferase family protein [Curtobacterium luteum]|uniref:Acyltransferase 3 domain-containing protein n=1 Tax=Curtobacterium luteum TaxID=33881 RepID=A0A175S499_9MICO|nr:acyltransferase [Curtobacterium luteum]KTR11730.1 hypothetical protein NS184_00655 [Curtobacterium luteum]